MHRSRVAVVSFIFFLAGCASAPVESQTIPASSSSSSVAFSQAVLEKLPSELSIPHFTSMKLSGTGLVLGPIQVQNDAYTRHYITYLSNGLKISGVLLIPKGDGPFPLVIFNHGYIATSVYTNGRGLRREQDYIARAGFAVLHTDYRGHAESDESPMTEKVYDGNLEYAMDSANAILAVREAKIPSIDAFSVGMLGHSLGGGVTMAVLTGKPDLVDAAVLYAPVSSKVWDNFVRWRSEREEGDRTIEAFGAYDEKPQIWDELSPATFFSRIQPPILLFHGDRDDSVPKEWSDDLTERLKAAGKVIEYVEYEGEAHEFGPKWTDFMKKTAAFLHKHLDIATD